MLFAFSASAQEKLSFEDALKRTLEKNYDIRMAKLDEEAVQNNAKRSNNGYLPNLSGTAGYNWTSYQGTNELISGDVDYDPASSYSYNAALSLNYTLFDGQGRKFDYLQLKETQALTELQVRQLIENTILELSVVYYEVQRLEEASESLGEALAISKERLQRAEYAYEYGQSNQLAVLNAKVDLNNDSINLVNTLQQLDNTKRNLNLIMGAEIESEFALQQELDLDESIQKEIAVDAALENNVRVTSMKRSLKQSEYAIGSAKSSWIPGLGASVGYNYRGTDDPNGAFVTGTNSYGPNAGLTLNWSLFDFRNKTRVENARLGLESKKIEQQAVIQSVKLDALNAYGIYQNALFVLNAQNENVATAYNNFERSKESYKLGNITSVEFRQAQVNLLNTELQLSQAKYNAKSAELQLKALMGILLN